MGGTSVTETLMQISIFRGLTQNELRQLGKITDEVNVKQDSFLFREEDAGDALYIVLAGQIQILKRDRKGQHQELARIGDGGVLGEMSLLNTLAVRSASARASTDVSLLKIPRDKFARLLTDDSIPAHKVVRNLAQVMSRRLLMMDEKLVDLLEKGRKREEFADFQRILSNWTF